MQHCAAFHKGLHCFKGTHSGIPEYKWLIVIIQSCCIEKFQIPVLFRELSGRVLDTSQGVVGLSLTGVTVSCP